MNNGSTGGLYILTLMLKLIQGITTEPIILFCFSCTAGEKGTRKPYQQDREGLELV